MKRKTIVTVVASVLGILCAGNLVGRAQQDQQYSAENTYFDGKVAVHYFQTRTQGQDDYVSFTINRTGDYRETTR